MNDVLIINGDLEEQANVATVLQARGISCRVADSEHGAVLALLECLPSIIVWDWPAQDIAPEIFLAILRQEGFNGTILVCTASLDVDDIPFDIMLKKPYQLDHLTRTVGRLQAQLESELSGCNLREA